MKESYTRVLGRIFSDARPPVRADYAAVLERYQAKSELPGSGFFYSAVAAGEDAAIKAATGPTVGYFCNAVPEEIVMAAGGVPVRLCSSEPECFKCGEEIIPADACPVVKSICGAAAGGRLNALDLIVVPATCDAKVKLAEILTPSFAERIHFLDLPREGDYLKNAANWTETYTRFLRFLAKRFSTEITRRRLLEACAVTNRRTQIYRRIYELRARTPGLINAFDYYIMGAASFFTTAEVWSEQANGLYEEAEAAPRRGSKFKGSRVLLSGAPIIFPNFKILDVLDDIGCDVAADTLCSTYGRMYDPVEIDEDTEAGIIRSLALKYLAPTMCPCFVGIEKLLNLIVDTVEEYNLDGVIYYNLRLCQVFDVQTSLIRHVMKDGGIPFLAIKTDLGREDIGQLKTRAEAFLEMLG